MSQRTWCEGGAKGHNRQVGGGLRHSKTLLTRACTSGNRSGRGAGEGACRQGLRTQRARWSGICVHEGVAYCKLLLSLTNAQQTVEQALHITPPKVFSNKSAHTCIVRLRPCIASCSPSIMCCTASQMPVITGLPSPTGAVCCSEELQLTPSAACLSACNKLGSTAQP